MKQCTVCKQFKELSCFSKNKTGCKACAVIYMQARQRTLKGLLYKIFQNQKQTSKAMGRHLPTYTLEELSEWAMQRGFEAMWQQWVSSGFDKWECPSFDRLDNTKGYSLDNLQLVKWVKNLENQKTDNKSEKTLHPHSRGIEAWSKAGEFIKAFASEQAALRWLDKDLKPNNASNLKNVADCKPLNKSAYGYVWKWAAIS